MDVPSKPLRPRLPRLPGLLVLLVLAGAAAPAAANDWIYVTKQPNGVRSFSDMKPVGTSYHRIPRHGRQTATASCMGVTENSLRARAADFQPFIDKYARDHGVSPRLVSAVMRVESCYDRHAVSRSGARGLMQLMPATAAELGVRDSFNAEQNIEGGVRYLSMMMRRFKQDLRLGLAAYNAGPLAVEAYDGVPPYPETVNYVKRILKLYQQES